MSDQPQDLVFFDDNSLISERILAGNESLLHVISHSQHSAPSWLVNALVENCLLGSAHTINRDFTEKVPGRGSLIYVSFLHQRDYLVKSCRKQGLDLDAVSGFHFVDCFTDLFTKDVPNPTDASESVEKLFKKIGNVVLGEENDRKCVVIEGVEILLAATNVSSNALLSSLQTVNRLCKALFVVANIDGSMFDMNSVVAADPVFRFTDFVVKLIHKSSLNISLLPLPTGKARDITGSLTVARGALPPGNLQVSEGEYLYNLEPSLRLFFR